MEGLLNTTAQIAKNNPELVQIGLQSAMANNGKSGGNPDMNSMPPMGGKQMDPTTTNALNLMNSMNNGMDMTSAASNAAMMSGNPEIAAGIQAASIAGKWYGKWNGIYTVIIWILLIIICWWIFTGILSGSMISVENGWEFSTGDSWNSGS